MKRIIFIVAILCLTCNSTFSQVTKESLLAKATSDSSRFAINVKGGWLQYGSSIAVVASDSVMLEAIVQHQKTGIDWTYDQFVGKMKLNRLRPAKSQTTSFNLLTNIYQLRIEPNGKCYLRLVSGVLPDADPVIIPIRAVYKK